MSRRDALGRKIETITHNNGQSTPLYFNQRSMEFTVTVGPDTRTTKDGSEARRWAMAMLGKSMVLTWIPVAEVDLHTRYRGYNSGGELSAAFEFEVDRFWLAETSGGSIIKLEWKYGDPDNSAHLDDQDDRLQKAQSFRFDGRQRHSYGRDREALPTEKIKLPRESGDHHYLPYTPELWVGLRAVIDEAQRVQKVVTDLVTTKAGLAQITKIGAVPALMAGPSVPADSGDTPAPQV